MTEKVKTPDPNEIYLQMRKEEEEKWKHMTINDIFPPPTQDTRGKEELLREIQKLQQTVVRQTELISKLNEEIIVLGGRINAQTYYGNQVAELKKHNQELKALLESEEGQKILTKKSSHKRG